MGIAIGVDTASKRHLTYAYISPASGEITTHGRIEVEPFEPISYGMGVKQPFTDNPSSDVRFYISGSVSAPTGDGSNIWMTHTVMKPYFLAVRWYRLAIDQKSGLLALAAWGEISQPHYDHFNASILSFGKDDYTVLSLSRSGDSTTPTDPNNDGACGNIGAYAALVREKPGGQFQFQLTPLKSGMADNYIPGAGTKRWGDYTTIFWDPKIPRAIWTINQFVARGGDATSEWRNALVGFLVPPV